MKCTHDERLKCDLQRTNYRDEAILMTNVLYLVYIPRRNSGL